MKTALRMATAAILAMAIAPARAQLLPTLQGFCNAPTPEAVRALISHPLACGFDRSTMSYSGNAVEQARCLLRRVLVGAELGPPNPVLPRELEAIVGLPVSFTRETLLALMKRESVRPEEVGGALQSRVSKTSGGYSARYFVIHDTSTPNYELGDFPTDLDQPSWKFNSLQMWQRGDASGAHTYIARTGTSVTAVDYITGWRATKSESCVLGAVSRGLFLHNELVQPRKSDPAQTAGNDLLAPSAPYASITTAQYDRLAIAYLAASFRAGQWMIPAFHAVIDHGLGDGHDDPQGFDLDVWAQRIGRVLAEMEVRQ